jgi:uncharacterized repeat protein (TIGR01451 family)
MTSDVSALRAESEASAPPRRRLRSFLVAVLVAALAGSLLPAVPAAAATEAFGLGVSAGGKTTVSSTSEVVSFELTITPPVGGIVDAGAVTTLTLDESLRRTNNGPLPAGATKSSWDEATSTLTVTWGKLSPGSVYSIGLNAVPSLFATAGSTFQTSATITGRVSGVSGTETVTSTALTALDGVFPDVVAPRPQAGDWKLAPHSVTTQAGVNAAAAMPLAREAGNESVFKNYQVAANWTRPVDGAGEMSKEWFATLPAPHPSLSMTGTVSSDTADARVVSYGAYDVTDSGLYMTVTPPAGTPAGTYAVAIDILDDGELITGATFTVTIPEPARADLTAATALSHSEVIAGEILTWNQGFGMPATADPITDLVVTVPVPAHTTVQGASVSFQTAGAKRFEYTTDADLDSASWSPLPRDGAGAITLGDPSAISAVRYVLEDFRAMHSWFGGAQLTYRVQDGTAPGTRITVAPASIAYSDPVAGPVTYPDVSSLTRTTTVVPGADLVPAIAGNDTSTANGDLLQFGNTWSNGNSFRRSLFVGSSGTAVLDRPFIFTVVPKGMSVSVAHNGMCDPMQWRRFNGCADGQPLTYPSPVTTRGAVPLSDGSTLYYDMATTGQLPHGRLGATQMVTEATYRAETLLAGEHPVLVGMGSMAQGEFTVDASRTRAGYVKASLDDDASYGGFAAVGDEIADALKELGVTAGSALIAEKSLTISPSTSVGSVTSIQGSEDAAAIVQGAGTATTRPGGTVKYQIDVANTGSKNYESFQFIDVLPYRDDTFTSSAGSRGSTFDVNLSGNVKVLVDGKVSDGASIEYSTSSHPSRFDANGATINGEPWLPFTGSATGARALRVTLAPGVTFSPGSKITLSFDATVPASAPRDGSLARNTIAYRFQTSEGEWVAAETASVAVKSAAPAGDISLAGVAFLDGDGDGLHDAGEPGLSGGGVSLRLYQQGADGLEAQPLTVVPNLDAGVDGAFAFVGLKPNAVYAVKPSSANPNVTFSSSSLDADGFLKYLVVTDAAANASVDTTRFVGKSTFELGDAVGLSKWIKDLRVPLVAKTSVSGSFVLTDPDGVRVGGVGNAFVQGVTVRLRESAASTTVIAETTTDATGDFLFDELDGITPGDHVLEFTLPNGDDLVATDANNPTVFSGGREGAPGRYLLTSLQPGVGAADVEVFYTDLDSPTVDVAPQGGIRVDDSVVNPDEFVLSGTDVGTAVASYRWKILDAASESVDSGKADPDAAAVAVAGLDDGEYAVHVHATDVVGNQSDQVVRQFVVDRTAPVLTAAESTVTSSASKPRPPQTDQEWVDAFGVQADDGSGVGVAKVTVDATAVSDAGGAYDVVVTATDRAGNAVAKTLTYIVAFVGVPVVEAGNPVVEFEMGTPAPKAGEWTALFDVTARAGHADAKIVAIDEDASQVDLTELGDYEVSFVARDEWGVDSDPMRVTLRVVDTIAPTVASGIPSTTFAKGDDRLDSKDPAAWIDLFGASAEDSGSGIAALEVDASAVDYNAVGKYDVILTARDRAGNNHSITVRYDVIFAGDPAITLLNEVVTHELGTELPGTSDDDWISLFGAVAKAAPGASIASLIASDGEVDFSRVGEYPVVFRAVDDHAYATTVTATVRVTDTTPPAVTLARSEATYTKADAAIAAEDTAAWIEVFGAVASDSGVGVPADALTVDASLVDHTTAGRYPVTFRAVDRQGNSGTVVGYYTVTLPGAPTVSFERPLVSHELGAAPSAAGDDEWIALFGAEFLPDDHATIREVTVDAAAVVWTKPGDYQVSFTVVDDAGNTTVSYALLRVADTIAPTVTLASPSAAYRVASDRAWDAREWMAQCEIAASDYGTGVDDSSWTLRSTVDWTTPGSYSVKARVSDRAGNVSDWAECLIVVAPAAGGGSGPEGPEAEAGDSGPSEPARSGALAETGGRSASGAGVAFGAALLLAGLWLLVARRRRRQAE